ncbi:MAG: hypothetical protein WCG21_05545 [Eubacteriales bacterium]
MNKLQDTIREHAFSETAMLSRIRLQTLAKTKNVLINRNIWISAGVAAALMFVFAIGANIYSQSYKAVNTSEEAIKYAEEMYAKHQLSYALVCLDINPSFEIYTDVNSKVIEIEAVNEDARTLNVSSLVGLPVDDAISDIIALATTAGFINSTDDAEDYVIVSTVLLTAANEDSGIKQDELNNQIEKGLAEDETLDDSLNVAIIKANQVEMFEAKGKDVPMGLYVINGMIENNGEMIPVSEFVSNSDNLNKLKNHAAIVGKGNKNISDETPSTSGTSEETKVNTPDSRNSGKQDNTAVSVSGSNNGSFASVKRDNSSPDSTKPSNTKPGMKDEMMDGRKIADSSFAFGASNKVEGGFCR